MVEIGSSILVRRGSRRVGTPPRFALSDNEDATCKSSAGSSSEMAYPRVEDLSEGRGNAWPEDENEPFEEYEGSDRTDPIDPLLRVAPNVLIVGGGELALKVLVVVSIELRRDG